ncbi:MAG TPA: hypothetical protein VFT31_14860 [Kribbella sp.]|nr:hypothetical protein [Kribbella sp.]
MLAERQQGYHKLAGAITQIYAKIEAFANFGFAESHSISFALLVYASTWLRLHYPAAFLAALLRAQPMGFYPIRWSRTLAGTVSRFADPICCCPALTPCWSHSSRTGRCGPRATTPAWIAASRRWGSSTRARLSTPTCTGATACSRSGSACPR